MYRPKSNFMRRPVSKWRRFTYNYRWSDWVSYIDGWIPKFAFFVPIIGYLIIFNDEISARLSFNTLVANGHSDFGLSAVTRLHLIYFGLIFLGVSNFLYRIRRPYLFRHGTNQSDFAKECLQIFTYGDFVQLHDQIRHEGHRTFYGKYYDSEWDGFKRLAEDKNSGTDNVEYTGNWEEAKRRYGSLLLSILYDTFFNSDITHRASLTTCIILSTFGYVFLIIPSGDIFTKVVISAWPF